LWFIAEAERLHLFYSLRPSVPKREKSDSFTTPGRFELISVGHHLVKVEMDEMLHSFGYKCGNEGVLMRLLLVWKQI